MPYAAEEGTLTSRTLDKITEAVEKSTTAVAKLPARISEVEARMGEIEQAVVGGTGLGSRSYGASMVDTFMADERFAALRAGAPTTGRVQMDASIGRIRAETLRSTRGGDDESPGTVPVRPGRIQGLYGIATRPLTLLDLLPRIQVDSNSLEFVQVTHAFSHGAGYQAKEGDTKAEQSLPMALVASGIATIAVWLRVSTQVLADTPAFAAQLGQVLTNGVLQKLEAEIVAGPGTARGSITGLLAQATTVVATGTPADRIGSAIAALAAAGWSPGAVVMNPTDWFTMRSERNEHGYLAGSWADPAPPSIWGQPAVLTSSIPLGQALVLDPAQVAVLDRMQPSVQVSREDRSNFIENLATILVELRSGLAVLSPLAVGKVTLT